MTIAKPAHRPNYGRQRWIVFSGAKTASDKAPRNARRTRPKHTRRESGVSKLSMATVKSEEILLFDAVAPSRGALKVGPIEKRALK